MSLKETRCYHNARRLALCERRDSLRALLYNEGGYMFMMMEYITIVGFIFAVFCAGVAVGKLVEKIERLDRKTEDEDKHIRKNDRR